MLGKIDMRDFDDFLKQNQSPKIIHFILPGVVISGVFEDYTPETIHLHNATIYTGLQAIKMPLSIIPRERIIAWGAGKVKAPTSGE